MGRIGRDPQMTAGQSLFARQQGAGFLLQGEEPRRDAVELPVGVVIRKKTNLQVTPR